MLLYIYNRINKIVSITYISLLGPNCKQYRFVYNELVFTLFLVYINIFTNNKHKRLNTIQR